MPCRSSMDRLRQKIFRRKSASFTKIDELDEIKDETENEVKNMPSSSKTWTTTMGKSLRRKLSVFRKEIDENDNPTGSRLLPEQINIIHLRKVNKNDTVPNSVRFASVDEMALHRYRDCTPMFVNSSYSSDIHLQINPNSELNYARLMQFNSCYEAMPASSKMVVFDTKLQLRKAFNGLVYQNTRHVLLSDASCDNAVVGILSVTDFIRVLLRLHKMKNAVKNKREDVENSSRKEENFARNSNNGNATTDSLKDQETAEKQVVVSDDGKEKCVKEKNEEEEMVSPDVIRAEEDIGTLTISEYRDLMRSEGDLMDLVSITAEDSLLKAAQLLSKHHIHRLPVLDPYDGSPLFILTHKRILKFLWLFGHSLSTPDHHRKTCKDLGVGTFDGIRVVYPDTSLTLCLDILLNKGVSGVPVVEHNTFRVVDMYSRFDAIGVVLEDKIGELDVTVQEALAFRNTFRHEKDRVVSIKVDDSFWTAVTVLVERNVHRLCVLRDSGTIEGLISLSDVINYLVVKAAEKLPAESPRHHLDHHSQQSSLSILQEGRELATNSGDHASSSAPSSTVDILETKKDDGSLEEQHGSNSGLSKQFAAFSMD